MASASAFLRFWMILQEGALVCFLGLSIFTPRNHCFRDGNFHRLQLAQFDLNHSNFQLDSNTIHRLHLGRISKGELLVQHFSTPLSVHCFLCWVTLLSYSKESTGNQDRPRRLGRLNKWKHYVIRSMVKIQFNILDERCSNLSDCWVCKTYLTGLSHGTCYSRLSLVTLLR